MEVAKAALLVLTVLGTLYYVLSALALAAHFRRRRPTPSVEFRPSVSLLKPVSGSDPQSAANFRTFLAQDYPDFEVLFGAIDDDDPALSVISPLIDGIHNASIRTGSGISGANNKVRILHRLAEQSTGEVIVITDADTRVTPDFIRAVTAPFAEAAVGVVTCMYRGVEAASTTDALEGLYMTCIFAPGVACAQSLGGIDFGLGAAIAIRRETLDKIGGFKPLAGYLADDFQLGRRAAMIGQEVVLSDYVIEVVLSGEGFGSVLSRELRWSVTTRVSRPSGHLGLIVTFGFAYAAAYTLVSHFSAAGWVVLASVTAIRAAAAYLDTKCLGDRDFFHRLWLLPARDLLAFGIWVAGYFRRSVVWRGRRLAIAGDGTMRSGD